FQLPYCVYAHKKSFFVDKFLVLHICQSKALQYGCYASHDYVVISSNLYCNSAAIRLKVLSSSTESNPYVGVFACLFCFVTVFFGF
ncbi:hypothetical protein CW304_16370, partial [Bacillus sp. UFRGS-B20]